MNEIERSVQSFILHLKTRRHLAVNTLESYRSDLKDFAQFGASRGVTRPQSVTRQLLRGYFAGHLNKLTSLRVNEFESSTNSETRKLGNPQSCKPGNFKKLQRRRKAMVRGNAGQAGRQSQGMAGFSRRRTVGRRRGRARTGQFRPAHKTAPESAQGLVLGTNRKTP
ncbi:MAG: site-specific integrase [Elusimicrobia bacterium]|nr:site-specific integrase [Elusimicrobiota bacterium]